MAALFAAMFRAEDVPRRVWFRSDAKKLTTLWISPGFFGYHSGPSVVLQSDGTLSSRLYGAELP